MKTFAKNKIKFVLSTSISFVLLGHAFPASGLVNAPGTNRLDIEMSPEARESLKASTKTKVPSATMRIVEDGQAGDSVEVKVGTRGQSSLKKFPRKNMSVKPTTKEAGKLKVAGIKSKELILSAGPEDALLIKNLISYRLMNAAKVPTLETRLAEVVINNQSQGLYMITASPASHVLKANPEADVILRRRYNDAVEVKKARKDSKEDPNVYVSALTDLHVNLTQLKGEQLLESLTSRMDLEQYMRWTAVNFLLKNGDYSDEVFFVGSKKEGKVFFSIFPWDLDDTFAEGSHFAKIPGSANFRQDERINNQMIFSFESRLDQAISENSVLLEMYFDVMEQVAQELSGDRIDAIIGDVQSQLAPYLKDADILENGKLDSAKQAHDPAAVRVDLELKKAFLKERLAMIKAEIAEIKQDPRDRSERFGVFAKKIGLFIMGKAGQFAK
jgi:hypothetical protein